MPAMNLDAFPQFPDMADLDLAHKPVLDALFRKLRPRTSELTFTNLYIWRHAYGARVTRLGEAVCVFSLRADPEESFLLTPLGPQANAETVREGLTWLAAEGHNPRLSRIDREEIGRLGLTEEAFTFTADRDNWDYVYRVADLIALPEDRYPEKFRHFQQFAKKFKFEYRPLTPDLVPACQELQDLWCDDKHCDLHSSLRAEARAVKEVLGQLEPLGVTGGTILVNDRVQAFSLGEPLNDDTVVIHIEKATPELHGAFQVINQQFLEHAWADWTYVNREQDTGGAGLRHAKETYLPIRMIEKFEVTLRHA
jgi:uncharacterized protein